MDTRKRLVNGPSRVISLGLAAPLVLKDARETAFPSRLQTRPAVSSTAACCSVCRSQTENECKEQLQKSGAKYLTF